MKDGKLIAVDLFSGAGGLSEGLKNAGFDVSLAVDIDYYSCLVYGENHRIPPLCKDIKEIKRFEYLLKSVDLKKREVDLIAGGPPCQGFSVANKITRNENNEKNKLVMEFVRIIKEIHPPAFIMENVTGLMSISEGCFINDVISDFEDAGYTVSKEALNAADFGVPQMRNRIFIVGMQHAKYVFPKPSHGHKGKKPYISVGNAILADLPELNGSTGERIFPYTALPQNKFQRHLRLGCTRIYDHIITKNNETVKRRISAIPQGASLCDLIKRGELAEDLIITVDHKSVYRRLSADLPSVTIGNFRKAMLIHPTENRLLSLREAARLQSFQDKYRFSRGISHMQQLIGNSVPPLLSKAVATPLYRNLLKGTNANDN
jgi:DNA (cytosine-5)-methyltransferase 1